MQKENVVVKKVRRGNTQKNTYQHQCHSRVSLSGILTLDIQNGGDPRLRTSGMTPLFNKGAFTLIELLVVVLIIGILAAVAVPQYRMAVAKTQLATVKNLVKTIKEAQDVYYTANGEYATTLDELDVSYPNSSDERNTSSTVYYKNFYCWIQGNQTICNISTNIGTLGYQQSYGKGGSRRCTAMTTDLTAPTNKLCKAETGDTNPTGETWRSWQYRK